MTATDRSVPHLPPPPLSACLLSNGRYTVMTRDTGSGFTQWRNRAVTRWREDVTADMLGSYLFLRDRATGAVWSATPQPLGASGEVQPMRLVEGRAEYGVCRESIDATLAVAVPHTFDGDVRRLTIRNERAVDCELDVTSYAELVLGSAATDAAHPAFSKLFVETQWWPSPGVIVAGRRPRSPDEPRGWAAHGVAVSPSRDAVVEYETDRARFIGRGRSLRDARGLGEPLSQTTGTVLDAIFSARVRLRLAPGASASVAFWTLAAASPDDLLAACAALASAADCDRVIAASGRHEADVCARIGIADDERTLFQRCVAPLFVTDPTWRSPPDALARGAGGAPVLWSNGISGDRPIVLLHVAERGDAVAQVLRAQRFWQAMGVGVDVVLSNVAAASDGTALQAALDGAGRRAARAPRAGHRRRACGSIRRRQSRRDRCLSRRARHGGTDRLRCREWRARRATGHGASCGGHVLDTRRRCGSACRNPGARVAAVGADVRPASHRGPGARQRFRRLRNRCARIRDPARR